MEHLLPLVSISHNLKKYVADIHRQVFELFFKLFLRLQDDLNLLLNFILTCLHIFACTETTFCRSDLSQNDFSKAQGLLLKNLILVGSKVIALERPGRG